MKENPSHNSRLIAVVPGWSATVNNKLTQNAYNTLFNKLCDGFDVQMFFFPNGGTKHKIEELTEMLADYFEYYENQYEFKVLLGHSMGGCVAGNLIAKTNNEYGFDGLITTASPMKGTKAAWLAGMWSPSAKDMMPNSEFTQSLRKAEINIEDKLALYAQYDYIVPRSSAAWLPDNNQMIGGTEHLSILFKDQTAMEIWGWLTYGLLGESGHNSSYRGTVNISTLGQLSTR